LGFLTVTIPLVLMPGASTAIVLRNSLSGGVRAGLVTTVGVNAGSLFYGLLCAFGFALAMQRWPMVWQILRAIGIAYLAWLGLQSIRHAFTRTAPFDASGSEPDNPPDSRPLRTWGIQDLRQGFLTNALNPSIATFYFAVLPQFIPKGASVPQTTLLLTGVHIALAASCHTAWAIAGGTLSRTLASGRLRLGLDLAAGLALLLLAGSLIF